MISSARWHILAQLQCLWLLVGCSERPSAAHADGGAADGGPSQRASGAAGSLVLSSSGKGGGEEVDAGCRRAVSLTAVTLSEPAPFDVVIVADNSDSLSWSRDDLSAGLVDLLNSAQGRAMRIFLLTSTQFGASSAAAQQPVSGQDVVDYRDAASGRAYSNAMTLYSQSCTDPDKQTIPCPDSRGATPYDLHGSWTFQMPQPIAIITPHLSASAFAAQQQALRDAIVALSGGGGSAHEQPMCTLARYLRQDRALLPQNAVFIVISDEDDRSTPRECLAGLDASLTPMMNAHGIADACTNTAGV